LKTGMLGLKKKDVEAKVAEMRANPAPSQIPFQA